jgi:hypothetical protein
MVITLPVLAAVIALIFGILILIVPRALNFLVAIYLHYWYSRHPRRVYLTGGWGRPSDLEF